jgi:8-oxo-dGTP pyrophosphatase MutT (NUDIX family)
MRWTVHGQRTIYTSKWVDLLLVDVEPPGGERFEHHVVRLPHEVVAVAVLDRAGRVLMLRTHRFITGSWGWELPEGVVDPGETLVQAGAREVLEETGWRPGPLRPLLTYEPSNGIIQVQHHLFRADGATYEGPPSHAHEAERVEWIPLSEVRGLIDKSEIVDGPSLIALLHVLAFPTRSGEGAEPGSGR